MPTKRKHSEAPAPDQLAIEQYQELRSRYLNELGDLMGQYGIIIQFESRATDKAA